MRRLVTEPPHRRQHDAGRSSTPAHKPQQRTDAERQGPEPRGGTDVTVRDILAHELLATSEVIGGATGLDVVVRSVSVVSGATAPEFPPGALVVMVAPESTRSFAPDVLIRYAAELRGAAILVPERLQTSSSARIADRFGLPTITYSQRDPYGLAHTLELLVVAPQIARAGALLDAAEAILRAGNDSSRAVTAIERVLRTTVRVVDAEGAALTGPATALPEGMLASDPRTLPADDGLLVAAPILLFEDAPSAWIVAGPVRASRARVATILAVLEVAGAALAGGFARRHLALERDVRFRANLLGELLRLGGPPSPQLANRVLAAGWRTAGWHVGVHITGHWENDRELSAATPRVHALLSEQGINATVVQVSDGWSAWITTEREPDPLDIRSTVRAVRSAIISATPDYVLHAGVGAPHAGVQGIALTIEEARNASTLAAAAGRSPRVEHVADVTARQLLLGWAGSDAFRAYAESLLAPLLAGGDSLLLETLSTYLDHESSTTATAALLEVHRNTVAQRIRRAEELLGVSLSQPEERLTIHLACRLLQTHAERRDRDALLSMRLLRDV